MSTLPAAWAGLTAVIFAADTTLKLVAAVPPNATAVAPEKLEPLIVTDVPPAVDPRCGTTEVIAGEAAEP